MHHSNLFRAGGRAGANIALAQPSSGAIDEISQMRAEFLGRGNRQQMGNMDISEITELERMFRD